MFVSVGFRVPVYFYFKSAAFVIPQDFFRQSVWFLTICFVYWSNGPDAAYHAVLARKVFDNSYPVKTCIPQKPAHGLALVISDFQIDGSARLLPGPGLLCNLPVEFQAIFRAIKRHHRFVFPHFRLQGGNDCRGDVGRVGCDDVEGSGFRLREN